jgi:hypothetical protein
MWSVVLSVAACTLITNGHGPVAEISVSDVGVAEGRVETVVEGVDIFGYIDVADPCYDFTAHAEQDAEHLTVTVHPLDQPGGCAQVLARYYYVIHIRFVRSGPSTLVLVHEYTATYSETVMEEAITVP